MVTIRPIKEGDWDQLWSIAHKTGVGFTSLQPNEERVCNKLECALASFNAKQPLTQAQYLFVLEDLISKQIAGIAAIESAIGLDEPWTNFRIMKETHNSSRFDIRSEHEYLVQTNEFTGVSELCTLFLLPEFRKNKNGHLLSKSRMLFMSAHEELFHQKVMAEMRGYIDSKDTSPFWEAVCRSFFSMDFAEASIATMNSKNYIAELMPRNPVYIHMLPKCAQNSIGKTHKHTLPALKLLEKEGMKFSNCIDIFDAGPVMESYVSDLRIFRERRRLQVRIAHAPLQEEYFLISNLSISEYRCIAAHLSFDDENSNHVTITSKQADVLQLSDGDEVIVAPLFAPK